MFCLCFTVTSYFRSGNQNTQLNQIDKAFLSSFYGNQGGTLCLNVINSSSVLIEMEQNYKALFEDNEFQEIELSCSR